MRIGLHIVRFDWPGAPSSIGPTLRDAGVAADEAGIAAISLMDHWLQIDVIGPVSDPMLEGYTSLGFLAGHTSRLRLRLLVSGVTYRHPGLLAKQVATLDVLSEGRAQLGIGAAWYEREHAALGVPYPPLGERFERLEEALQICRQMWGDDDGPFTGRHYQLAETLCAPGPFSPAGIPIIVGGNGEKKTLRLVAQYADACNLMVTGPDDAAPKLDVLRAHCDAVGRDYDALDKTVVAVTGAFGDLDQFLRDSERYEALGIDEIVVMTDGDLVGFVERVGAEVVPRVGASGD
jgi:F420-dependent oxidoreductase-like protein